MENKQINYYNIDFLYVILFIAVCLLGAWANNTICPPQYTYYLGVFVGAFSFSFFEKIINPISEEDFNALSKTKGEEEYDK